MGNKYEMFNVRDSRIYEDKLVLESFSEEILDSIKTEEELSEIINLLFKTEEISPFGAIMVVNFGQGVTFVIENNNKRNLISELLDFGYDDFILEKLDLRLIKDVY